ncbi:MAG: DUF1611 domain-containing protein [Congregibacter sp.]
MLSIELRAPYLLFTGDECRPSYAKTAQGIADWRRDQCVGQHRLIEQALDVGLPDFSLEAAIAAGAKSLVIGTALVGGSIPANWVRTLCEAAERGLDIVAGLHTPLTSIEELVKSAEIGGARLIDVRTPPPNIPVGTGEKRTGKRLLTVGTDCALGKKYTALCLERDMRAAGMQATFRASGQTGIMIASKGIPIDCIVSDFVAGAAELLSPANEPSHWDVIEGQGGLMHPGYAAVSLGLLMGSQPDAFVVCHEANRTHISGWPDFPLPRIGDLIERTRQLGQVTNANIRCGGISVNTSTLVDTEDDREAEAYLRRLEDEYELPCVDAMRHGTQKIIENL